MIEGGDVIIAGEEYPIKMTVDKIILKKPLVMVNIDTIYDIVIKIRVANKHTKNIIYNDIRATMKNRFVDHTDSSNSLNDA